MSVSSDTSSISYVGNNSTTTAYEVPFVFFDSTDLKVYSVSATGVSTLLALSTNYTVSGGAGTTGSVTTTAAIPATSTVLITRSVPYTQLTSFTTGDRLPAASIEKALDKLTMSAQQLSRNTIPDTASTAGTAPYVLGLGATGGTPTWTSQTAAAIADGAITSVKIADGSVTTAKVAAGAVTPGKLSTGGPVWDASGNLTATSFVGNASTATSAARLTTPRTIGLSGDVTGTASFDGSANATIAATISPNSVVTEDIADANVTTSKLADNAVTVAKLGTTEQRQIAKCWVNFNGATVASDYTTGNTITYVDGASTTTVRITRASHVVSVGDWVTVSGVTGATSVNGTYQVTAVTATTIVYVVPSVVTGTVAGTAVVRVAKIRSSYNVSSVSKLGVGDYQISFQTPMADADYSIVATANSNYSNQSYIITTLAGTGSVTSGPANVKTTTEVRILTGVGTGALFDVQNISVIIFGN